MIVILSFLFLHWYASAFAQSFFLHRYTSHKQFTMSPFWEKFFYLFTFFAQGSSFLHPKSYALLHLEHHTHSDTKEDPHSPHFFRDVMQMMLNTRNVFMEYRRGERTGPNTFADNMPTWDLVDRLGNSTITRLAFVAAYVGIYVLFAPSIWWFLLIPIHIGMGPLHGAFINWCGHKYGYRNFDMKDESRNTFLVDLFFVGECFQNNHHKYPNRPNFAVKWFEFDILYPTIRLLGLLKIIRLKQQSA
jgi:stearoyl-CoA desaturase (delta-9 desaturase)